MALPVFDEVLADIGDRQSIEMSLSTFSGHVANLVVILGAARERSLVLVDELASGTDPVEGSALAQALLTRFAEQARLTIVTTHYPELKEWASSTDGVANAATGFDPDTHAPLYRVALGRPGTSHALQIAERLGLDADVVEDARGRVAAGAAARSRSCSPRRSPQSAVRRPSSKQPRASAPRRSALPQECASARRHSSPRSQPCASRPRVSVSGRPPRRSETLLRRVRSYRGCARRSTLPGGATARRGARHRPRRFAPSVTATGGSARPRPARRRRSRRCAHSTSRCR